MKFKLIGSALLSLTLASTMAVAPASAATNIVTLDMTSMTMPTVPDLQTGDSITFRVTGLTGNQGIYAVICKSGVTGANYSTYCDQNQAHQAWVNIAGGMGASAASVGGTFTVSATYQNVDCTIEDCIIYVSADHNNSGNQALSRIIPLTFVPGGSASTPDVVTGTAGGNTMTANVGHNLRYQTPITFDLETESGLPVTLESLTPDCAVDGNVVTALAASGVCAIAATTTGNGTYAAVNINYPFYLKPAVQTLSGKFPKISSLSAGSSFKIKRTWFTSNLDQNVYVRSNSRTVCVVNTTAQGWTVKAVAKGTCHLTASSNADADGKWNKVEKKTSFKVIAKK